MKLNSLMAWIGIKQSPKRYLYDTVDYTVDGVPVTYAQWRHPKETTKRITDSLVASYREYIGEGDFCVDIGAHSGDTALPMALAAGKSGCVLALEPNPFVYPVLEKVARANRATCTIETILAAAGKSEGFMTFEYSDAGFCNGGCHENIPGFKHGHFYRQTVFTLDLEQEIRVDFSDLLDKLSFIKVDTEGYDLPVLESFQTLIGEYRPVVKAEIYKKSDGDYRKSLLAFFQALEYTVYRIRQDPLEKGEKVQSDTLGINTHYDILALPE